MHRDCKSCILLSIAPPYLSIISVVLFLYLHGSYINYYLKDDTFLRKVNSDEAPVSTKK